MSCFRKVLNLLLVIYFIASNKPLQAQTITLIPKNYTYYNAGTGASTSDRVYYFMLDGSAPRKIGNFGQHIRSYLSSDTTALKYLNAYRSHQTFKLVTAIATVGSFIGFAAIGLKSESVAPENLDKPAKGKGFLYATIGFAVTNIITRLVGTNSMHKAVEAYNAHAATSQFKLNGIDFDFQNANKQKTVALPAAALRHRCRIPD